MVKSLTLLGGSGTANCAVLSATGGSVPQGQTTTATVSITGDGSTRNVGWFYLTNQSSHCPLRRASSLSYLAMERVCAPRQQPYRHHTLWGGSAGSPTTLCSISFPKHGKREPRLFSPLTLANPYCATDTAPTTPCTATAGSVAISGGHRRTGPGFSTSNRFLLALLSTTPPSTRPTRRAERPDPARPWSAASRRRRFQNSKIALRRAAPLGRVERNETHPTPPPLRAGHRTAGVSVK